MLGQGRREKGKGGMGESGGRRQEGECGGVSLCSDVEFREKEKDRLSLSPTERQVVFRLILLFSQKLEMFAVLLARRLGVKKKIGWVLCLAQMLYQF